MAAVLSHSYSLGEIIVFGRSLRYPIASSNQYVITNTDFHQSACLKLIEQLSAFAPRPKIFN